MPVSSEDQIRWILETVRECNSHIASLSAASAAQSMALKILGVAMGVIGTALCTGLVALAVEVFKR